MATSQAAPSPLVKQAVRIAAQNGIPPQLFLRLVNQESGWNTSARSPAGALGLTQLMPGTAAGLGVRDPFNPTQNLQAGARYLREQFNTFRSWPLALAAYNAGPGAVQKYHGIPPYSETQAYVHAILGGLNPQAPPTVPLPAAVTPAQATPPAQTTPSFGVTPAWLAAFNSLNTQLGLGQIPAGLLPAPQTDVKPVAAPAPLPPAPAPAARTAAPTTNGYPPMTPGKAIPLRGLTVAAHADWRHVDRSLLQKLQTVARTLGVTVQIISGYRSPSYSAAVGGYATDPHTRGVAVDAYINGRPIGDYPGAYQLLTRLGLESGAQPGFYHGQPDPEHVQIPGSGVNKTIRAHGYLR